MSKPITVEWGLEISIILTAFGAVLLLGGLSDALDWWLDLGGWGFWVGGTGIVLLLVGLIWLIGLILRRQQFNELIVESSRAAFVKSLDELEYTAWRLPSKYDVKVIEKKKDMGVK
ncbi:MAG: hypothetical protein NT131_08560 [Methanomassiliicoccales archaeon]|nr:hypothetical protein [Methanomassiliicoccales archaeon]